MEKGSIYVKNQEQYWECDSCKHVNKTYFGKPFLCEDCHKDTFKRSRKLDASREEILIGKRVQWWVCGVCRYENHLQNKACLSCHAQRNNVTKVEKSISGGVKNEEDRCPLCSRRD